MKKKIDWFSFFAILICMAYFFSFDFWMTEDFIHGKGSGKTKLSSLIIYMISKNKYGYWVIRGIPLLIALIFLKNLIKDFLKIKEK